MWPFTTCSGHINSTRGYSRISYLQGSLACNTRGEHRHVGPITSKISKHFSPRSTVGQPPLLDCERVELTLPCFPHVSDDCRPTNSVTSDSGKSSARLLGSHISNNNHWGHAYSSILRRFNPWHWITQFCQDRFQPTLLLSRHSHCVNMGIVLRNHPQVNLQRVNNQTLAHQSQSVTYGLPNLCPLTLRDAGQGRVSASINISPHPRFSPIGLEFSAVR